MKVIQPREFNPRKTLLVASVLIAFGLYTYTRDAPGPRHVQWNGSTMGTHYAIRMVDSPLTRKQLRDLRLRIEEWFEAANDQMSTYRPASEISVFNRSESVEPHPVSPELAAVVQSALELADRTGGAFDPTLDPLINLWGFGHEYGRLSRPDEEEIREMLNQIGYRHLSAPDAAHIRKSRADLHLNLNAIAKGYAVDRAAAIIRKAGITNLYVEIGGDLVVYGVNREGQPWRIGIDWPDPELDPGEQLHGIAHLTDVAMATSGDYRRFVRDAQGSYSHIIDPRTGYPIDHALASVTVIAPTCMEADALATALFVMGSAEGLAWVERQPGVEAFFIDRAEDGSFTPLFSSGFEARTGYQVP